MGKHRQELKKSMQLFSAQWIFIGMAISSIGILAEDTEAKLTEPESRNREEQNSNSVKDAEVKNISSDPNQEKKDENTKKDKSEEVQENEPVKKVEENSPSIKTKIEDVFPNLQEENPSVEDESMEKKGEKSLDEKLSHKTS